MPIILTGFGPFGSVSENPSSLNLEELRKKNLHRFEIHTHIPVSVKAVDAWIDRHANSGKIYVHFGVNQRAKSIQIEHRAFNEMLFQIPDVDGFTTNGQTISPGEAEFLLTRLSPLVPYSDNLESSDDAGRYICNYIYYRSLQRTNGRSLFIHVPPYSVIPQGDQLEIIQRILDSL